MAPPVDTVVAVVLPSQLKVGEVQTSLDLVDSSVGVGTLLPPPAPAAEDYTRYCSAGVVVVPSSEVVQCLLDSLEEEAPEAHPRIECPVVERAAAGAARIRSEEVGTRSCVSSPKRNTRRLER